MYYLNKMKTHEKQNGNTVTFYSKFSTKKHVKSTCRNSCYLLTYSSMLNVLTYLKERTPVLWNSTNFLYIPFGVPPVKRRQLRRHTIVIMLRCLFFPAKEKWNRSFHRVIIFVPSHKIKAALYLFIYNLYIWYFLVI